MAQHRRILLCITTCILVLTASCSYNPFRDDNQLTGSAGSTAIGAGVAGGGAFLAGASKAEIGLAGIAGGLVGYYVSTLRFASGGVMHVGGHVYAVGDNLTIEIPADQLFDTNSAEFLPGAGSILDSAIAVLNRKPKNNILISGNTSGYYSAKIERKLSEDRARQVAAYFWAHGITNFNGEVDRSRHLTYVGYSHAFPISNDIKPKSIQENSRIQITSYPSKSDLGIDKKHMLMNNVGASSEEMDSLDPTGKDSATRALSGGTVLPANPPPTPTVNNMDPDDESGEPRAVRGEMWDDLNTIEKE